MVIGKREEADSWGMRVTNVLSGRQNSNGSIMGVQGREILV